MTESVNAPSQRVPEGYERIFAIGQGFWHSRTLAVAAELELADILAEGPLGIDDLANRTKTHAPSLFRMMRALESLGVFAQVSPHVFANNPVSDYLRRSVPGSLWAITRAGYSIGGGEYEAWGGLLSSIQTGKTAFDEIYGSNFWEFLRRNPNQAALFNEGMRSLSGPMTPAVTASYNWSRFPVIADVGGGIGTQLVDILNAHPSCRGILFDQPQALTDAIPHDRVETIGGSFLQSVPPGADAYILRCVIHDWADEESVAILKNVRAAMQPGSRLILIEHIVVETPELTPTKWLDMHMLVLLGGKERTAAEYRNLLKQADVEVEEIVPTPSPLNIIVSKPRD